MSGESRASKNSTMPEMPNFAPKFYGIALLVGAIVLVGIFLIGRYTANDRARDLQAWQEKLNLIAESRTSDVNQWVGMHFKELQTLSNNPSLQLYMMELQSAKATQGEPPQKSYLRNLLVFSAERGGFSAPNPMSSIPADVIPESKSGLAIIDRHNDIVVSTLLAPSTHDLMLAYSAKTKKGKEALIDIGKSNDGIPVIGFLVPVFSIQGSQDVDSQIGWLAGILTVDGNLFNTLKSAGIAEKTLETILVRNRDGNLDYISPLEDGTKALGKSLALDKNAAAIRLVKTLGNFVTDLPDYRGKQVLATSRAVPGTPWTLIVKVDRQEALAASDGRRDNMVLLFSMLIAIIVLIVVALWRYAQSKRALMMSSYFQALAARTMAQEELLSLVSNNQPETIYMVDTAQKLYFSNKKAADEAGMAPDFVIGKTLADMYGAAAAQAIAVQCGEALEKQETVYETRRSQQDGEDTVIRSAYVPLAHIPVASLPKPTPGVLVIGQDISDVVHEREQRLDTQRQLIETLVKLVDRRDPFAANHSLLVSQIAREVAGAMGLDMVTAETTRIAGSLMNIGKILVPRQLLTKTESLTPQEKAIIHESMNEAAVLLKDISFDGPVAETLRQWQEKWDGSGQLGMQGDSILISARIIAVTNAFVGMISTRSWRTALSIEAAAKFLLDQCDSHFDRRVVVALVNYVENSNGREWLKAIVAGQKGVV